MFNDPTGQNRSPQAENDQLAYSLRAAGMTYQQIADRLDVDVSTAHRRVQRALFAEREKASETVHDVRDLDLAKLAWIERSLLSEAVGGDRGAARLLMQIVECRKRYLKDLPPRDGYLRYRDHLINKMLKPSEEEMLSTLPPP